MTSRSTYSFFADQAKLARFWFLMFGMVLVGYGVLFWRLAASMDKKTQVIVMDSSGYYLPRVVDFQTATDLHEAQVYAAVESIFNRGPAGLDHQERLKRLFDKPSYAQAIRRSLADSEEFKAKEIHQKVEISDIRLLQVKDETVLATFEGQLIRSGIFGGKPIVEALSVKGRFTFSRNGDMAVNGAYPTVVRSFEFDVQPVPRQ